MTPPPPGAARALGGTADDLARGCREDMARAEAAAARLRALPRPAPLAEGLEAFDEAFASLGEAASRASLARNVHPDAAFREVAERAEVEVAALATRLSLDRDLYEALLALAPAAEAADPATRHFVARGLRDFRRAGVDKDDATRARVQALQEELVAIGQEFGRNIRDDVKRLALEPARLDGLPEDWRRAHPPDQGGRVTVTTEITDYAPFMAWCRDGAAREALWRLYRQRAHPANEPVLARLLARRAELAGLLGHPSWAAWATEDKMIGSAEQAAAFVEEVARLSGPRMEREYRRLLDRAREEAPGAERVAPWDSAFLQERIKAERFGFDSQALRPYLEYGRVKQGVLDLVADLFGLAWRRVEGAPAWHEDVEGWDLVEPGPGGERPLGRVWLDMFPRPGKYPHFAQFTLSTGKAGVRLPEGALVCNFPRPAPGAPALLQHADLRTFLHEFGHLLHHLLGGHVRWAGQSGVATEWDFVEAPSQMLEEWTWDHAVLARFARHHETGEPVPAALVERLQAAEEYGKGLMVRQQMFYAAVSLELHRRDPAALDPAALVAELQGRYTPFAHQPGTSFHLSFGHLDGYSALYYTYMWSLVIAKDLFGRFARAGLMDRATADRYRREVLAAGGSRPAEELVRAFLGRPVSFEAWRAWLDRGEA